MLAATAASRLPGAAPVRAGRGGRVHLGNAGREPEEERSTLADGTVRVGVDARWPLREAGRAHEALDAGGLRGQLLLVLGPKAG